MLYSSCLLTRPASTTLLQHGAGRAGCRQGSGVTSPASDELRKSKPSLCPCRPLGGQAAIPGCCLPPRAARQGPDTSVSTWQSIFKSQAAGPGKSNYGSQACAPVNAGGAAFPGDIASHPVMEGSETESGAGRAELRQFSFLRGRQHPLERLCSPGTSPAPSTASSPPRTQARSYPQMRGCGGCCPADEGQKGDISPFHDAPCEQRGRTETTPCLCQTPLLEDSH